MSEERTVDGPRIERAVHEVLLAIGEDPGREGLIQTPERVAEAYAHVFSGLYEDLTHRLKISFAVNLALRRLKPARSSSVRCLMFCSMWRRRLRHAGPATFSVVSPPLTAYGARSSM